jgi:glutathione peroxidase
MYRVLSYLFFLITTVSCSAQSTSNQGNNMSSQLDFYSLKAQTLEGKEVDFSTFKGKKVLVVNTATECGLTPQLEGLQKLHEQYKNQLVIVGIPTNDFKGQEPRNNAEIGAFCERNYGVEFIMLEKGTTKGGDKHPVFKWLTEKAYNGKKDSRIWWNFQKYLVDEKGVFVDYFLPITQPDSKRITSKLK